jgi:hypothetical protein
MIAYIKQKIEFILSRNFLVEKELYIDRTNVIEFTTYINIDKTFTLYREK